MPLKNVTEETITISEAAGDDMYQKRTRGITCQPRFSVAPRPCCYFHLYKYVCTTHILPPPLLVRRNQLLATTAARNNNRKMFFWCLVVVPRASREEESKGRRAGRSLQQYEMDIDVDTPSRHGEEDGGEVSASVSFATASGPKVYSEVLLSTFDGCALEFVVVPTYIQVSLKFSVLANLRSNTRRLFLSPRLPLVANYTSW